MNLKIGKGRTMSSGLLIFVAYSTLLIGQVVASSTVEPVTKTTASRTVTAPPAIAGADVYQIGAGDVLQISVWREPDISVPTVVVRGDGRITIPLVKDIVAAGLTPGQLEQALAAKLQPFVQNADVAVMVREINSVRVYVVGAVKNEGAIRLHGPLTALQAIAECGGTTEYAKRRKTYILRTVNGRRVRLAFDYDSVLRGQKIEQDIALKPNDTVVVPH